MILIVENDSTKKWDLTCWVHILQIFWLAFLLLFPENDYYLNKYSQTHFFSQNNLWFLFGLITFYFWEIANISDNSTLGELEKGAQTVGRKTVGVNHLSLENVLAPWWS